jgi:hypothetical protein
MSTTSDPYYSHSDSDPLQSGVTNLNDAHHLREVTSMDPEVAAWMKGREQQVAMILSKVREYAADGRLSQEEIASITNGDPMAYRMVKELAPLELSKLENCEHKKKQELHETVDATPMIAAAAAAAAAASDKSDPLSMALQHHLNELGEKMHAQGISGAVPVQDSRPQLGSETPEVLAQKRPGFSKDEMAAFMASLPEKSRN